MLSKALRLVRIFHDLSQKELAEKLGISKSYLSEIESGKKNPNLNIIGKYSDTFDIPVSSIMFFAENLEPKNRSEKMKTAVSSKILAILNFIAEKSERSYVEE